MRPTRKCFRRIGLGRWESGVGNLGLNISTPLFGWEMMNPGLGLERLQRLHRLSATLSLFYASVESDA
jgi:hypothetical protein